MRIPKTLTRAQIQDVATNLIPKGTLSRLDNLRHSNWVELICQKKRITSKQVNRLGVEILAALGPGLRPGSLDHMAANIVYYIAKLTHRPTAANLNQLCMWCRAYHNRTQADWFEENLKTTVDNARKNYPVPKKKGKRK